MTVEVTTQKDSVFEFTTFWKVMGVIIAIVIVVCGVMAVNSLSTPKPDSYVDTYKDFVIFRTMDKQYIGVCNQTMLEASTLQELKGSIDGYVLQQLKNDLEEFMPPIQGSP